MGDFSRDRAMDMTYASCIYRGISDSIDFEMKLGWTDRRKEFSYVVARYCEEELLSGNHLKKKLEVYNKFAEEKYGELIT